MEYTCESSLRALLPGVLPPRARIPGVVLCIVITRSYINTPMWLTLVLCWHPGQIPDEPNIDWPDSPTMPGLLMLLSIHSAGHQHCLLLTPSTRGHTLEEAGVLGGKSCGL